MYPRYPKYLYTLMKVCLFTIIFFAMTSASHALDIKVELMIKEFAGERLNVRKGPGTQYKVLRTIRSGTRGMKALEEDGRWVKISWGKYTGWVSRKYLENVYNIDGAADYAVATSRGPLNVRYGPGQQQRRLFALPHGTKNGIAILALKQTGKTYWARISYKGKIGWVNAKYLKVAKVVKKGTPAKKSKKSKKTKKTKKTNKTNSYYVVKSGDTLFGVMRKTGVMWQKIAQLNDIDEPYDVYLGQRLKLR